MSRSAAPPASRVGPNAVVQLVASLRAFGLEGRARPAFAACGAAAWLADPPTGMLDAARVGELYRAVRAGLPPGQEAAVLRDAGTRTADYLLAHRIPRAAQFLLRRLPPAAAARLLTAAIRANAWTFGADGSFVARVDRQAEFRMPGNPLCTPGSAEAPACLWHVAVFQRLFGALVSPDSVASEAACVACGDPACRFVVAWTAQRP